MNRLITIALSLVIVGGLACQQEQKHNSQTRTNQQSVGKSVSLARAVSITSQEAARQAVVGIWTNSEPLNSMLQMMVAWNKFELREDGSADYYRAAPTDDDWGESEACGWEIISGKYTNTGKRYYGIRVGLSKRTLLLVDSRTIEYRDVDGSLLTILHKGASFPFS